jgi:hypothetical protein
MPTLKNPRHERFAQLIALGTMSRAEALRQAGFKAKRADQGTYELVRRPEIAARIDALRGEAAQSAGHRSIQAITRQELAELLCNVVRAGFSKPEIAKPYEALKAAKMLAKLCGWNEPERVDVQSVEVKVDAALIEQLRAGYAQLGAREKPALPLAEGPAGGNPRETDYPAIGKEAGVMPARNVTHLSPATLQRDDLLYVTELDYLA